MLDRASERQSEAHRATLDPVALGLTGGLTLAAWVAVLAVLSRVGWGDRWRRLFADLYPGYGSSRRGIAVGAAWAFLDGLFAGASFAWLYNVLSGRGRGA